MIIHRWLASVVPTEQQINQILASEGLEPILEVFNVGQKIQEHRHPYTEIRVVVSGQLTLNIAGNQMLLREGDRIEIPANTKHSYLNNYVDDCKSLYAIRL